MKCLKCETEMKCYNDVNDIAVRIDWKRCPNCGAEAELIYDALDNGISKVIWEINE